jgi:hypothetical protein
MTEYNSVDAEMVFASIEDIKKLLERPAARRFNDIWKYCESELKEWGLPSRCLARNDPKPQQGRNPRKNNTQSTGEKPSAKKTCAPDESAGVANTPNEHLSPKHCL